VPDDGSNRLNEADQHQRDQLQAKPAATERARPMRSDRRRERRANMLVALMTTK
jgi:hypothetical protein